MKDKPTQSQPATLRDDVGHDRYVAEVDGVIAGYAVYHLRGEHVYFFVHTVVEPEFGGRGLATALARYALDDVRSKGGRIVPICPFIAAYVERNPEYSDLVDVEIMDRIGRARSKNRLVD